MKFSALALAAFVTAGSAVTLEAAVLTFEGHNNTIYNAPIVRDGFTVGNVVGDEQHFHEIQSGDFGLPDNGTGILLNDRDSRIFMNLNAGDTFTVGTLDYGAATNNNPAENLRILGFLNNLQVASFTRFNLGTDFSTIDLSFFGTIDNLVFDGFDGRGGFVLDNVTLNAASVVPLPAALPLAMGGLALLGFAGRRRRG